MTDPAIFIMICHIMGAGWLDMHVFTGINVVKFARLYDIISRLQRTTVLGSQSIMFS
jgi:hypothetical protein